MGRLHGPSLTVYVFFSYSENFIWTSSELQVDSRFYTKVKDQIHLTTEEKNLSLYTST